MYLWEFELSDEKCGWFSIYQEAKLNYPSGKIMGYKKLNGDVPSCYLNPVKTFTLMKNTFSKFKSKAIELNTNRKSIELNKLLPEILTVDVCLYNLLQDWYMPVSNLELDLGLFSTFEYFSNQKYLNYHMYFAYDVVLYPELHEARVLPMFIDIAQNLKTYRCFF